MSLEPTQMHNLIGAISGAHIECSRVNCHRKIGAGVAFWIDRQSPNEYCDICGKELQYSRDRAVGRGEVPPITFEDVEARFQRAMSRPRKTSSPT